MSRGAYLAQMIGRLVLVSEVRSRHSAPRQKSGMGTSDGNIGLKTLPHRDLLGSLRAAARPNVCAVSSRVCKVRYCCWFALFGVVHSRS